MNTSKVLGCSLVCFITFFILLGVNTKNNECKAQGKELVRTMTNVYKCM